MSVKVIFFFRFIFLQKNHKTNSKLEVKCPTLSLNGYKFESTEIDKTEYSNCPSNYYVFQSVSPYSPIPNEKGEAICVLNNDNVTASWDILKPCEPTCLVRGGCDNNQICAQSTGENIEKCFCAGYVGKYCETVDHEGFFLLLITFLFK